MKCVIMAGGRGTRLWPISRQNKPKQFQCLTSHKTMLQETFLRLRKKFNLEDIYISTNQEYVKEVEKEILELPKENIIGEPQARGSASGIALASVIISSKCGNEENLAFFPADHLIKNPKILIGAIKKADKFLKKHKGYIVTIGIKPDLPETGFGYIKKGNLLDGGNSLKIFQAKRFVEKPDIATAQKYLDSGNFFWNSGMFFLNAGSVIDKFRKYIPDSYSHLMKIEKAIKTVKYKKVLAKEYPLMDNISFDYGIVENANKIAVIPLNLKWSDVGSWTALKDNLANNKKSNYAKGEHIDFNSKNILVYGSKKLVTTIGVKDLIIVDSDDAILICDRDKAQMVSDVVKRLEKTGKVKLL